MGTQPTSRFVFTACPKPPAFEPTRHAGRVTPCPPSFPDFQNEPGDSSFTLEGLHTPAGLHPVQQAFLETQAAQCGYCLNGMVMMTVALLQHTPAPSDAEIRQQLSHNLCRCGTHLEILQAVHRAALLLAQGQGECKAETSA